MALNKYDQPANLAAVYNAPRRIAGQQLNLTDTGNGLYFDNKQICGLLGISEQTLRGHITTELAEYETSLNKGGAATPPPLYLTSLLVTVVNAPIAAVGGGGGTQNLKLRHIELVIRVAMRTANSPQKKAIIDEMVATYSQYQQQGFVVNEYAVQNSPTVLPKLQRHVAAYNFSPERYGMVVINKTLDGLFMMCTGNRNLDGTYNRAAYEYFKRCCHNTAHVAATGMTAMQIRYVRSNPNHFTFGQQNFRGKYAPKTDEINNACNFLFDYELLARTTSVDRAVAFVRMYIEKNGPLDYHFALQMFTMYCSGTPYLKYISDDWRDYPETAVDNLLNPLTPDQMRPELKVAAALYLKNFPNRHTLPSVEAVEFHKARQMLIAANIDCTGLEDVIQTD